MANIEATMSNILSYSFNVIIISVIALLLELSYDTLESSENSFPGLTPDLCIVEQKLSLAKSLKWKDRQEGSEAAEEDK